MSSLVSYSFDHEIINEEVYNIIHKLDSKISTNDNSLQILQKLMEYSAKQTVWQGLAEDDTIILHYPGSITQGSFGLNFNHSESESNPSVVPLTHQTSLQQPNNKSNVNLDDGIIQSDSIIEKDNCVGIMEDED